MCEWRDQEIEEEGRVNSTVGWVPRLDGSSKLHKREGPAASWNSASTRGGLSLRHLQPCIIEAFTVSSSTTTSGQRVISTPMEKEADLLVFFRKIADLLVYMNKMMDILY